MQRALKRDPRLQNGSVIPVKRVAGDLPTSFKDVEPLYVNLINDRHADQWDLLLRACDADLGADAPEWLRARDDLLQFLRRQQSVNLVVSGNPRWRELVEHVRAAFTECGVVDLDRGAANPRWSLVAEILRACNAFTTPVPKEPEDLVALDHALSARPLSRLILQHFDHVAHRSYGVDLFAALRHLVMDARKLVLLYGSATKIWIEKPYTMSEVS